jgi:hypothetical protein
MNRRLLLESLAALFLAPLIPAVAKSERSQPYSVTIHPSDDDDASIKAAVKDVVSHGGGTIHLAPGLYCVRSIALLRPHEALMVNLQGAPNYKTIITTTEIQ